MASLAGAGSGYSPAQGEQFFLLADSGFSSRDVATVRLEAPGRSPAIAEYGGADIVLYRVPQPLDFLKSQRNLHRIQLQARHQEEGLANTLAYLWDRWYKRSRQLWQSLFNSRARESVVKTVPALKQAPAGSYSTRFGQPTQFKPLAGYQLVSRFRYPIHQAKAIAPPADVKLEGSSSEFLTPNEGNVRVPLGVLKPGLYVVEAYIGSFRATTLLFVADTVAATKISGKQLLVWTADKKSGKPVAGSDIAWTDGAGTLKSGRTDSRGLLVLERDSPERSYVMGSDAAGGVFVSENFYYDSEIYSTKLFAVTDRPLYRPGDTVNVKLVGREFVDALSSKALAAASISVDVLDANGTPLLTRTAEFDPVSGADVKFRLPENAGPGGYQLRTRYQGEVFGAAFRVAQYVKPQYEINLVMNKPAFKTGEKIEGKVQLNYPDGKPVVDAGVQLTVKAQKLTMVEAQLDYLGNRMVALDKAELKTGKDGVAEFSLPAVDEPSRYVVSILSSDQAAYRVATSKEILVQAGQGRYELVTDRRFSAPKQAVSISWKALTEQRPQAVRWESQRLEDRTLTGGPIAASARATSITFAQPGSYTVRLFDGAGNLLGATPHWVSGPGLAVTPGSITVLFDKSQYLAGETAHALVSFDQPMDDALLTLERDRVEAQALLSGGGDWLTIKRDSPLQWRVDIPVRAEYGPNMAFSVLTVKNGQQVFQNKGLVVQLPRVQLSVTPQKPVYRPGELVTVDLGATLGGKAAAETQLFVSVVDEMIYVLQPEIAPDVFDFFYHVRRNNVRTGSSLNFHSYDMALSPKVAAPESGSRYDRPFKVMERPRREDVDTAAWISKLATDADGRARITFRVPDSLTRWRITVRAMTRDGMVGQAVAHVRSDKPLYVKWIGPTRFRAGDTPSAAVAIFNPHGPAREVELVAEGLDAPFRQKLNARAGASYVSLPLTVDSKRQVTVRVLDKGQEVDALVSTLVAEPAGWISSRTQRLALTAQETPVRLPADANNVRLSFGGGNEAFARVLDELISYPYGCVEQTASRLIPLTLALDALPAGDATQGLRDTLEQRLQASRLRLVQLAGPEARFGWWGDQTEGSSFLTSYAYYADTFAARRLGVQLPPNHSQPVLESYQKYGVAEPLLNRAISLWLMQQMGLPTTTLAEGLLRDLQLTRPSKAALSYTRSVVLGDGDGNPMRDMTLTLLGQVMQKNGTVPTPELAAELEQALAGVKGSALPLPRALALLASGSPDAAVAADILDGVAADYPTIDRSLTLIWVNSALGGKAGTAAGANAALTPPWSAARTLLGSALWRYPTAPGKDFRLTLASAPEQPVPAQLSYDTREADAHRLPVKVVRTLYRLTPGSEALQFTAEKLGDKDVLKNNELYVDEVELTPPAGKRYRYGLVEVPLPPGADIEPTTWGLKIDGLGNGESLQAPQFEAGMLSYAVPLAELNGRIVVRHLLRFSQRGRFSLPPARYWRMYQAEDKALQDEGKKSYRLQVD